MVIDRTRTGTQPMLADLADAARRPSAAEQLAARVAVHAHCPVLLRTLHIGAANLKSRATCDSTVPPRSPTDDLTPSGQRRCSIHPEHCCKVHADAVRGCNLAQIAAITMVTHARASGAAFQSMPAAACGTHASRMHGIRNLQLAGSPAVASRPAEAARCFEVACEHPDARL